jgi:hypothetical protein
MQTESPFGKTKHGGKSDSSSLRAGAAPDDAWMKQAAEVCTALLLACLAPGAAMAVIWSLGDSGHDVFAITFGVAFGHAVLLGLPLYLILRSRGWINVATCVIAGFAVGAGPDVIMSWLTQHPQFDTATPMMVEAAAWTGCFTSAMHFGTFGALSGLVFGLVLRRFDATEKPETSVRVLQLRLQRSAIERTVPSLNRSVPRSTCARLPQPCAWPDEMPGAAMTMAGASTPPATQIATR